MSSNQSTAFYHEIKEDPGYRVTRNGDVWGCRKQGPGEYKRKEWRKLKPKADPRSGHLYVVLCPQLKRRGVHQLVLELFVGPCPKGMQCRHFPDRNPANNRLENLQWGTAKQNVHDMLTHGTINRGEKHHLSKLTPEKVMSIRKSYFENGKTLTELSKEHNVTKQSIYAVVKFITWKHLFPTAAN